MIWLLVPVVAVCMGYVCWYVAGPGHLLRLAGPGWSCGPGWMGPGDQPVQPWRPRIGPSDAAPSILSAFDQQLVAHVELWRRQLAVAT